MEVWGGNDSTDRALIAPGLDVDIYAEPYGGAASGGDLHYVSSCASGRITRMLIADVSGHGSSVAEVAIMLRDLMRRYINFIDQRRLVRAMNRRFEAITESGQFATALVTTYFAPRRRLTLCNAGHPPPMIRRAATGTWTSIGDETDATSRPVNIPLGVIGPARYEQTQLTLEPDDTLLFYTDALSESRDRNGTMLGTQGLLEVVRSVCTDDAPEGRDTSDREDRVVTALLDELRDRHPENLVQDDVTALCVRANHERLRLGDILMAPVRVFTPARDRS